MLFFEWDEIKSESNVRKHGLKFADAVYLFEKPMLVRLDDRTGYGELRYLGFGYVKKRLMSVVYTERTLNTIRIISFRKANKREKKYFEAEIQNRLEAGRSDD